MSQHSLIDTNVWLDVINNDPLWFEWSAAQIDKAAGDRSAALNVIIYAELSVRYREIEHFEQAISAFAVTKLAIPYEAGFLAAKAFQQYKQRSQTYRTTLPDFFIGAHAAVANIPLITRDAKRYRTYFPTLTIICPT